MDETPLDLPERILRLIDSHFQAAMAAQEVAQAALAAAQAKAQRYADALAQVAHLHGHDPSAVRYDAQTGKVVAKAVVAKAAPAETSQG